MTTYQPASHSGSIARPDRSKCGAGTGPAILLLAALMLFAPSARAEPVTKRAVFGNTIQAKALTERVTTSAVYKEFFVAYGGFVSVSFKVRSNGTHTVNWEAYFGVDKPCFGSTSGATYQNFLCQGEIEAGETIKVYFFSNGQQGAICCARMLFDLVNVNAPAVATHD